MTPATYVFILVAIHAFLPTVKSTARVETTRKSRQSLPAWMILGAGFLVVFPFIAVGRLTVIVACVIVTGTIVYILTQMHVKQVKLQAEDDTGLLLGTMSVV